ncbi:FGGY family carbohydrate kinase [Marispirochaeta sp.]|uniref:FGGY family carbohydrate kinase n=1 Tax=Marispirochaeta sp. TaxID=2038653 RepID=UPI0029C8443B|nr:FGGY family carbohydrate kinase [Marispirochaeta sp.]
MASDGSDQDSRWILALDAGGSGIRATAVGRSGKAFAMSRQRLTPLPGPDGAVEFDPEKIWKIVISVTQSLFDKHPDLGQPDAVAVTVQRATFCLWEEKSGKPITNLISWSDVRSAETAARMNRSVLWRIIRLGAGIAARVTGNAFLRTASMLRFTTVHVSCRLKSLLDQNPSFREACREGVLRFGTLDTWLLFRMSGGRIWATDTSNAAATSLYNPFKLKWNRLFCWLFDIPVTILPPVLNSVDDFGMTDPDSFAGVQAPVKALVGDQMAALFGHRCFDPGEVKVSKGSGGFVTINVGPKPRFSPRGLFPLIAWSIGGKATYMLEGQVASVGTLIDWLSSELGFAASPEELDALAEEAVDSGGVVFLPTPLGIRFPYFRSEMRCAVFGLGLGTTKSQLARAMYEGIAYRIREIIEGIEKDLKVHVRQLKVDGGVSRSTILVRLLSASCGIPVLRSAEQELSSVGAACMAGIGAGWWRSEEELRDIPQQYEVFSNPREEELFNREYSRWRLAVHLAHRYSRGQKALP